MTRGWFSLLSQELRTLLPFSLSHLGAAGSDCRRLWDRPETGGREGTAFSGRSARFCAFGLRLHSLGGRLTGVGKPAHCPLPSVPRTSWPGGMNGLAHPQVQATFIVNDSHESRPGALPAPFQACTGEAGSAVACPREASLPPARRPGLRGFVLAVLLESLLGSRRPGGSRGCEQSPRSGPSPCGGPPAR